MSDKYYIQEEEGESYRLSRIEKILSTTQLQYIL